MRISNTCLRLAAVLGACAAGLAAADDLTLSDGEARLSGTVRSISADGVVELASGLSREPLYLKAEAVGKIEFSDKVSAGDPPSTLVELANGDRLPAVIESLDAEELVVVSPEAGRLEIPRKFVKSMQLGLLKHKMIYQGPGGIEEWSHGGEEMMKNWAFERDALVATGPASATRKLPLPRQFILRCTLVWQQGVAPNFQIFFADPLVAKGEPCDRYYLQFGGAGMEIKRESATGKRYNTIAILNRSPEQYPDQRLRVEIMVNRDAARLGLILNGESEGEFADPIADVPDGSGITLSCNPSNGKRHEIRDIVILEYDDLSRRHRSEERGDPSSDSLISREDDRWTGRLIEIRDTKEGARFVFKTDFQEAPVEIPEAEVSTVFLSGGSSDKPDRKRLPFVLRLPGDGLLGVSSCQFTGESVSAIHPLLGPLSIRSGGIMAIERLPQPEEPAPEK